VDAGARRLGTGLGWLGWRLSTVAVWLTFDAVVVRDVGRTRRLALAEITGMTFRRHTLTVATAWPARWVTLPARLALVMAAAGLALLLVSQLLTHLSGVSLGAAELGSALCAPGFLLFFPVLGVTADHLFHRARS
jgi:hypothetical protein